LPFAGGHVAVAAASFRVGMVWRVKVPNSSLSDYHSKIIKLGGIAMSHKVLLGCGIFAGLAFCTQACAAEAKYDMTSCYSGPSHVIQQRWHHSRIIRRHWQ
jgi:hypothetical protein